MSAVAGITWHDNFKVFLPLVSSDSITSEKLTRKESLSSNQSTTINTSCYLYHMRIESSRNREFTEYTLHSVFVQRLSRVPSSLIL